MKNLILLFAVLISFNFCKAQQGVSPIKIPAKNQSIFLNSKDASLDIVGYDGDDVIIQPLGPVPASKAPVVASGLKLISSGSNAESDFKPEITQKTENRISIVLPPSAFKDIRVFVPKNSYLNVVFVPVTLPIDKGQSKISISNMNSELEIIGAATLIALNNVTGPVYISARDNGTHTAGAQKVILSYLKTPVNKAAAGSKPKPLINIIARYADVILLLPTELKADIQAAIDYGDLYSNMPLTATNPDAVPVKNRYNGQLNGGGDLISIYAGYGNVYIRQQKFQY